jgi:23S rRNA pseudouridine2605 synthase
MAHSGSPHPPAAHRASPEGPARLQKILAAAGLGSRRQCEELIRAGRVEVDGRVITELGTKADPRSQTIRVDGVPLARPRLVYFAVNKPPGVVSTSHDPSGRPRVIDLVPYSGRLFTVGRLDMSSEGLILVTNDGPLADHLTHPRYGVAKTYRVEVAGILDRHQLERLRRGVHLAEGFARVLSIKIVKSYRQSTLLEIVLAEGRNREIRRLLARVGHKVERLQRIAIGPLRLADLPVGQSRPLEPDELRRLKRGAAAPPGKPARRARPARARARAAPAERPRRSIIGGDSYRPAAATAGAARPRRAKSRRPPKHPRGSKPKSPTRS